MRWKLVHFVYTPVYPAPAVPRRLRRDPRLPGHIRMYPSSRFDACRLRRPQASWGVRGRVGQLGWPQATLEAAPGVCTRNVQDILESRFGELVPIW